MRIIITTVIIWAILFGFFVTGVKVMATSPQYTPIQVMDTADDNVFQPVDIDRSGRMDEAIRSTDDGQNSMRLNR